MGASQRRKGATWERELAARWRARFPGLDTKRGIGQMRDAAEVSDVEGLPGFWVEAKCGAMPNPRAALKQAQDACGDRPLWCVAVVKDDRHAPFVAMTLEDFEDIAHELFGLKGLIKGGNGIGASLVSKMSGDGIPDWYKEQLLISSLNAPSNDNDETKAAA